MDYRSAGVDIDKADKLIDNVKRAAKSTYDKNVLSGVGGFGALYELGTYRNPVLVSSTDGVGTKILLARQTGYLDGLGYDLVAMCVDDVVCAGAKPLFFIDYIAVGKLHEDIYLAVIESVAAACRECGVSLIGGETAELPGMYADRDFDLAGFTVGVMEKDEALDPSRVRKGDAIICLASSGFHSNGYSLVRKVVETKKLDLKKDYGFGELGKALMEPTRIYSRVLSEALTKFGKSIKGIAHVTGGGIPGNLNRVLPDNLDANVRTGSWDVPPVIDFIVREGGIDADERYKVFNMGIGMVVIADPSEADALTGYLTGAGFPASRIGEIAGGSGIVNLTD